MVQDKVTDTDQALTRDSETESDLWQAARDRVFDIQEERWDELEQELFDVTV